MLSPKAQSHIRAELQKQSFLRSSNLGFNGYLKDLTKCKERFGNNPLSFLKAPAMLSYLDCALTTSSTFQELGQVHPSFAASGRPLLRDQQEGFSRVCVSAFASHKS